MSPENLQERVLQQPFEPFRVCLSDGATYEVRQAEMMLVTRRQVIIALPRPGEEIARRVVYCDPLHITRIEPINGRGTKPASKPRRHRDD
jgi:hypothetical protein